MNYYLKELSLNLGVIEFTKQKGISALANQNSNSVIRVHSIPETKMTVMSFKDAQQRYIRAAKERGVKILYLHPFFDIQKESNTRLTFSNLHNNTDIKDNMFQEKNMKRLPRK